MTFLMRLVSIVALVLVAAVTSWSFPTIYGDTGLVQVPTADVVPYTVLDISANYTQPNITGKFNLYPLRLTYGVGPNTECLFWMPLTPAIPESTESMAAAENMPSCRKTSSGDCPVGPWGRARTLLS